MSIQSDVKDRIFAAADRLYADSGRESFPTVDAVRREAKVDMNSASAAMKEWRKAQTAAPVAVAVAVPEALGKAGSELIASVWTQATSLANESLKSAEAAWSVERAEADALRAELSEAHDARSLEIEGLNEQLDTLGRESKRDIAMHRIKVDELQEQIQAGEKSLHDTRETLAETKGRLDGVIAQLGTAEAVLEKTETALTASEQRVALLEQQLQALREKSSDQAVQLDHANSRATQLEAQVEAQRQAVSKAEQATQAAQAKASEIDGQLRTLQQQAAKVEAKNETLETQMAALHKTLETLKSAPEPKA